jgi:hypothetical protein
MISRRTMNERSEPPDPNGSAHFFMRSHHFLT